MRQKYSYPDPEQLKTYARYPMLFHEIGTSDLEMQKDESFVAAYEDVEYRFGAADINMEVAPSEYRRISDLPGCEMTHTEAWDDALDVEIREDFICTTGMGANADGETVQVHAYWILESVTIEN